MIGCCAHHACCCSTWALLFHRACGGVRYDVVLYLAERPLFGIRSPRVWFVFCTGLLSNCPNLGLKIVCSVGGGHFAKRSSNAVVGVPAFTLLFQSASGSIGELAQPKVNSLRPSSRSVVHWCVPSCRSNRNGAGAGEGRCCGMA